uniref:Cation_ATPase_N domain-containing protein n=1 Tax=Syphacia muris TaxID=451379 RepID=A0A0N5AB94_9BILA
MTLYLKFGTICNFCFIFIPVFFKGIELSCQFYEHTLSIEQLNDLFPLSRICTANPKKSRGFNKDEAANKLMIDGRNVICPVSGTTTFKAFLAKSLNTFRMLLLIASFMCFVTFFIDTARLLELYMGVTLLVILILLCLGGYWQETKAYKQVRGFQSIIPTSCMVIRNGTIANANAAEIVVGDLIWLNPGCRLPADLRLIYTDELKLETSWLTGESESLDFFDTSVNRDVGAFESQNIAFNGCLCQNGEGIGIVIRTGNNSVMGKLVGMISNEKRKASRLSVEQSSFVRFVTVLAISMGIITFLIGLFVNHLSYVIYSFVNGFLVVVIANVPQGLPITIGAALIIVSRRLAKKRLYMKQLDSVDTLGATTALVCDKIGVFTSNEMSVISIWHDLKFYKRYSTLEEIHLNNFLNLSLNSVNDHLSILLVAMSLCNKAQIETVTSDDYSKWNSLSVRLYTSLLGYRKSSQQVYFIFIKAFPEELIQQCTSIATAEGKAEITHEIQESFSNACNECGALGYSLVAFAAAELEASKDCLDIYDEDNLLKYDLCFLSMIAMYTPQRRNIQTSIQRLRTAGSRFLDVIVLLVSAVALVEIVLLALISNDSILKLINVFKQFQLQTTTSVSGIKCFMFTTDSPSTALATATKMGFIKSAPNTSIDQYMQEKLIIQGNELENMTSDDWNFILSQKNVVFTRTCPAHKLIVIKECQQRKEIVAVTGDGVLDAPALKKADVGIALEAIGSAFAKEAAHMVLINGDLDNIVNAVMDGRVFYENLKKTVAYTLSHLIPELYSVLLTFILGFPLGLSTFQVLTIDLITELPPSIALIWEKAERGIMQEKPRPLSTNLVSRSILVYSYLFAGNIIAAGCIFSYITVFWYYGISISDLLFTWEHHWNIQALNFTSNGLLFTPKMQTYIRGQAAAAWHITLVVSQVFHAWICTASRVPFFQHKFTNLALLFATLFEIVLLNFFIYTPGVQQWIGVYHPPSFVWLFGVCVGFLLFVYNEVSNYFIH